MSEMSSRPLAPLSSNTAYDQRSASAAPKKSISQSYTPKSFETDDPLDRTLSEEEFLMLLSGSFTEGKTAPTLDLTEKGTEPEPLAKKASLDKDAPKANPSEEKSDLSSNAPSSPSNPSSPNLKRVREESETPPIQASKRPKTPGTIKKRRELFCELTTPQSARCYNADDSKKPIGKGSDGVIKFTLEDPKYVVNETAYTEDAAALVQKMIDHKEKFANIMVPNGLEKTSKTSRSMPIYKVTMKKADSDLYRLTKEIQKTYPQKSENIKDKLIGIGSSLYLWSEIAIGTDSLHNNGIIHMDLKAANALIEESDGHYKIKVCDFSRLLKIDDEVFRFSSSADYTHPMIFKTQEKRTVVPAHPQFDLYTIATFLFKELTGTKHAFYQNKAIIPRFKDHIQNNKSYKQYHETKAHREALKNIQTQIDTDPTSRYIKLTPSQRQKPCIIPREFKPVLEWCLREMKPEKAWDHRSCFHLKALTDSILKKIPELSNTIKRNLFFKGILDS